MRYILLILVVAAGPLTACAGSTPAPTPTPTLTPDVREGKQLFTQNCASCHSLSPDTAIVGPSLAGIATRAETRVDGLTAEQYLEQSILLPDAYIVDGFPDSMPTTFGKDLTGDELDALVSFLLTLE